MKDYSAWNAKATQFQLITMVGFAIALDPDNDIIWVYGGTPDEGLTVLDIVFTYTIATNMWEQVLQEQVTPPARWLHDGVVANDQWWIFGGTIDPDSSQRYNDLWAFQFLQQSWQQITPTANRSPPGRCAQAMTVTPDDSYMFVFGGFGPNGYSLSDLWIFDFASVTWYLVPMAGPENQGRDGALLQVFGQSLYTFGGDQTLSLEEAIQNNDMHMFALTQQFYTAVLGSAQSGSSSGTAMSSSQGDGGELAGFIVIFVISLICAGMLALGSLVALFVIGFVLWKRRRALVPQGPPSQVPSNPFGFARMQDEDAGL